MFVGKHIYAVDAKGRVALPVKIKKYINPEAENTIFMTRGLVECIEVYPQDYWRTEIMSRIDQLDDFVPEEASFKRLFLENVSEDNLDGQSRILIPKNLLEYAGIEKEVLILGQDKKIELWNPEKYEKYKEEFNSSYIDSAKQVMQKKTK